VGFIIHHSSLHQGFTLVEALVALSITAIVAVGVIGSVGAMMASSARNAEETTLSFLARAIAADIRLRGLPAEQTGVFDSHPEHHWRLETTSFRDPAGAPADAPALKEVLVSVSAPDGRTVALKTLVR
jgi:type II secretion system protein I